MTLAKREPDAEYHIDLHLDPDTLTLSLTLDPLLDVDRRLPTEIQMLNMTLTFTSTQIP